MKKNTKLESILNAFLETLQLNTSTLSLKKSLDSHPNPYSLVAIALLRESYQIRIFA